MCSYRCLRPSVDIRTMRIYIIGEIMFRIEIARGSHFHRSSICTWCRDQNAIKGSSMKLQGNQKIKDRMNRRSSNQDIKSTLENYFRLSTLATL